MQKHEKIRYSSNAWQKQAIPRVKQTEGFSVLTP
jgi:hypothetical protein